jgi:putative endonuclease
MEYTVYILYSAVHSKIYIGFTSNLLQRFHSHNVMGTKGYTKKYRPWVVIFTEVYFEKSTAMQREKQLKSASWRAWIWSRIKEDFDRTGFISA